MVKPQEVTRALVTHMHRAARQVDDDPWGDCLWGIITGYTAADALRVATATAPLVIRRCLGTTNMDSSRFERSCAITDWTHSPVLLQEGYTTPGSTTYAPGTPEQPEPLLSIFAQELETQRPQLVITSSHATEYNLEMPFSRGLFFSVGNRLHRLEAHEMKSFIRPLKEALELGDCRSLQALAQSPGHPAIAPDGTPRVWIAAGNCLFGHAAGNPDSMAVTAISAYTCNQLVGYTVPSWYGKGGWGTLSLFFGNTAGTSLAEAWFLNNQFLLHDTQQISPALLEVEFNGAELRQEETQDIAQSMADAGLLPGLLPQFRECLGLVYDRDVVAFYGDPAWQATLDESHTQSPYTLCWDSPRQFTLTAQRDSKGRAAVWFPTAETGRGATGCNVENAVFTNDFILFPHLEMKQGESLTVTIH